MLRGSFILVAYLMLALPFTLAISVAQDIKQASQPLAGLWNI